MSKLIAKLTALIILTLLATTAFAADANKAKLVLKLNQATTIAGVKLAPGSYDVQVTRDGAAAKVRVTDGSKELVNTTAQFREMKKFVSDIVLATNANRDVMELQSEKLKGALVFNTEAGTAQGNSK